MIDIRKDFLGILERSRGRDYNAVVFDLVDVLRSKYVPDQPFEVLTELDSILAIVSDETGRLPHDIKGTAQHDDLCMARGMCYELMVKRGYTQTSIGKYFRRKHETVGNGLKAFNNALRSDRELRMIWDNVCARYEKMWPINVPNRFVGKYEQMFTS